MWRLILYFESQRPGELESYFTEVRIYKTYRGALQAGRYYWRHRPDLKEYEVTEIVS